MEVEPILTYQSVIHGAKDMQGVDFGSARDEGVSWVHRSEVGIFVVAGVLWLVLLFAAASVLRRFVKAVLRHL